MPFRGAILVDDEYGQPGPRGLGPSHGQTHAAAPWREPPVRPRELDIGDSYFALGRPSQWGSKPLPGRDVPHVSRWRAWRRTGRGGSVGSLSGDVACVADTDVAHRARRPEMLRACSGSQSELPFGPRPVRREEGRPRGSVGAGRTDGYVNTHAQRCSPLPRAPSSTSVPSRVCAHEPSFARLPALGTSPDSPGAPRAPIAAPAAACIA